MVLKPNPSLPWKVVDSLKFIFNVALFFTVFYISLVLLSPLLLSLALYRLLLSIIFHVYYRDQFKLLDLDDGFFGIDTFGNVYTLTFFVYIEGPCPISELRKRIHANFVKLQVNGKYPYEKMLNSLVPKFGFTCWENKRNSFDICRHVRECSTDISSASKVCTEADVQEIAAKRLDQLWNEEHPRWEMIVVPQMRKSDSDEIHSAIVIRLHHAYTDGISSAQLIRTVVSDQPAPEMTFDPVNPPIPEIPWYVQLLWWVQVFLMGPYLALRLNLQKENHVLYEGPLKGGKFFGRKTAQITMKTMRNIRNAFGVCSNGIFHSAYTGAIREIAKRKGIKDLPSTVTGGSMFAKFPYPDTYPHNRVCPGGMPCPVGIQDPIERLTAFNKAYVAVGSSMVTQMANGLLVQILGVFPTAVLKYIQGQIPGTYIISNVPGISGIVTFEGHKITNIWGTGPAMCGMRYHCGITYYDDTFSFGVLFERSKLIQCKQDVDEFTQALEKQLELLEELSKSENKTK